MNIKNNKLIQFLFKDRITQKTKDQFFENFALVISSDLDINSSLKVLREETKSRGIRNIIDTMQAEIDDGSSIWKAIKNADILPDHLLSVIRIGESSGKLKENTKVVLKQIQKQRELKEKVTSASIYPILVVVLIIIVGLSMSFFVLPRITSVYKGLNIELPAATTFLISIGDFFTNYGSIVIPITIAVLTVIFFFLFVYDKTKHVGQELFFSLPLIGKMLTEVEVSRFGFLMGSLLKSGYPILDSIELLITSTNYKRYKIFYSYIYHKLQNGYSITQTLESYKFERQVMPQHAKQIIISAEKSGKLNNSLLQIGDIYEKKNETSLKNLTVLVEPVLLIIVWIGVSFVALSMILPIYSLVGNVSDASRVNTSEIN